MSNDSQEKISDDLSAMYLSTGQADNALNEIQMAEHFIKDIDNNYKWKWLAISLTNTSYMLGLPVIRHFDPISGITEKIRKKILKERAELKISEEEFWDKIYFKQYEFTISFEATIDWLAKNLHKKWSSLGYLIDPISEEEAGDIKKLRKHFRDEFIHMKLDFHSFHVPSMISLCISALAVIQKQISSDSLVMCVPYETVGHFESYIKSIASLLEQERKQLEDISSA